MSDLKKTTITISVVKRFFNGKPIFEDVIVKADVLNNLAVHRTLNSRTGWTVTEIRTGHILFYHETKKPLIVAMQSVDHLFDDMPLPIESEEWKEWGRGVQDELRIWRDWVNKQ